MTMKRPDQDRPQGAVRREGGSVKPEFGVSAFGDAITYRFRPPSMDAARTETDPEILERWAIRAAKRPELWRYRSVLYANPHMTDRGKKKLARFEARRAAKQQVA